MAHHCVTPEPVSVIDIFIAAMSPEDRLAERVDQPKATVASRPSVLKNPIDQRTQTRNSIKLRECQEPAN